VATFVAESWTWNKDIDKRLATFDGRVFRKKVGGFKVNENWRK